MERGGAGLFYRCSALLGGADGCAAGLACLEVGGCADMAGLGGIGMGTVTAGIIVLFPLSTLKTPNLSTQRPLALFYRSARSETRQASSLQDV
jgi:hypothetical protein